MDENPEVDTMALIPARAGSVRLPRKNHLMIGKRSLFDLAVDCALEAESVARIVVSTDDEALLERSHGRGLQVLERTSELAGDRVPMQPVVVDAMKRSGVPDIVVVLQPTSPFREPADVDACVERLARTTGCPSVMTVCETDHPVEWTFDIDHGRLEPVFGWAESEKRSQDLPLRYRPNGAVFAVRSSHLLDGGPIIGPGSEAVVMARGRSVDIDTDLDYRVALALHEYAASSTAL